jgi:hypothetical protein
MEQLWTDIIQWLHSVDLHLDGDTARQVTQGAGAVADAVGSGVAQATSGLDMPGLLALTASGVMLFVEFFADKIPWLDSVWDTIHTVIRIPAGALLAASVFGADNAAMAVAAGLMGGSLSATALATKMTTRAAANTSPEPFSNWFLSFFEDGLVVAVVWLATQHPLAFGVALVSALVLSVLLLMVLIKFLRVVLRGVSSFFHGSAKVA